MVKPLKKLLAKHGLNIYHAEENDIHGGTMRLWITNKDFYADTETANKFIQEEEEFDYRCFYSQTYKKIIEDTVFINKLQGKTVYFGAAAKGCVYLNALQQTSEKNTYVVDDTPGKQGLFVPGTGMQIKSRNSC